MIKFYKNRKWFYIFSLALMIIGVVMVFVKGVHLDIQFSGGAKISYDYKGDIDVSEVESIATDIIGKKASAQTQTAVSEDKDVKSIVISFGGKSSITPEKLDKLTKAINEKFSDNKIVQGETQSVEPYIGERFFKRGLIAMAIASVFIVIYVTIRFKKISGFSAAITSLIALLHDVLLVFFTFVIFGIPINDGFVAVILTILGYSVNDTIVIYDKLRYNTRLHGNKMTYQEIADLSINECMTRTVNTALMATCAIALVFIFALINGLTSVSNFALPMMVGIISGCYSTLTVPGTLWVSWQESKRKRAQRA